MTIRNRVLLFCLWASVIALTTWVGGTLYQMLVVVPMWSAAPPDSVRAFFQGTDYNRTIFHFFGPPFIVARNLPLVAALLAGWHLPRHRRALLIAVLCFTGFGVIFTLTSIYPINAVLFEQAGGAHSAEEIRTMVGQWIFRDRLRFAVGLVGFVATLWAFRLPLPAASERHR
jgi:hypothetical protein